jgi:hypothetical protein
MAEVCAGLPMVGLAVVDGQLNVMLPMLMQNLCSAPPLAVIALIGWLLVVLLHVLRLFDV